MPWSSASSWSWEPCCASYTSGTSRCRTCTAVAPLGSRTQESARGVPAPAPSIDGGGPPAEENTTTTERLRGGSISAIDVLHVEEDSQSPPPLCPYQPQTYHPCLGRKTTKTLTDLGLGAQVPGLSAYIPQMTVKPTETSPCPPHHPRWAHSSN